MVIKIQNTKYKPPSDSLSSLTVRVDGLQVSGSPFDVSVSAGPAQGANATVSGSALALATAGENSTFLIQARDLQANPAREGAFSSSYNDSGGEEGAVFNVTMRRNADVAGWGEEEEEEEKGQDNDNSTVVHATVEYLGGNNSSRLEKIRLLLYQGKGCWFSCTTR